MFIADKNCADWPLDITSSPFFKWMPPSTGKPKAPKHGATLDTEDPAALRSFLAAHGLKHTTEPWNEKGFIWKPQPWTATARMIHEQCVYMQNHSAEAILRFAHEIVGYNLLAKCVESDIESIVTCEQPCKQLCEKSTSPKFANTSCPKSEPVNVAMLASAPAFGDRDMHVSYCHTVDNKAQFSRVRPQHPVHTSYLDSHIGAPQ